MLRRRLSRAGERVSAALVAHWPLVVLLAVAGAIGFWRLSERGYVFIDEGYQHLEGLWVKGKLAYLVEHFPDTFDERRFVLDDGSGLPPVYAKPLHALLNALAVRLLPGTGPTPVLLLQGLLGLATIALVYAIGLRLAGRAAAVASAAVLAFSASFLAYRRSGLPEMDSVLFFTLAVWALVVWSGRGRLVPRRSLVVGILAGLCFTANDRWYFALPLIVAMAAVLDSRHGPWYRRPRSAAANALAAVGGFLIPLALFEASSAAFLWMAHDGGISLPYETYFQQLHRRYRAGELAGAIPRISQIPRAPYLGYLASFDGLPWLLVSGAAAAFALARWRRTHTVALLWAAVPLMLVGASRLAAPRFMSLALPGIALTSGLAAAAAWESRRRALRSVAAAALAVALASSLANTPGIFRVRGGWEAALAAVAGRGGGVIVGPKGYSIAPALGVEGVTFGYRESLAWARDRRAAGARWLLLEVWVPPGTRPEGARPPDSVTIFGPVGELSSFFLESGRPVALSRFPPHDFVYEGFPPHLDRLVILYDLRDLPPA